ncbi:MAG: hypothetical protein GY941_14950 [Planctomycetes bacterium]|nr:hypothetical protein [Planctomycetota bacterium]
MHRFDLFDRFCYPSVRSQTNQNFKWLVFFDENTPDQFKQKIDAYTRWKNFIPFYCESLSNLNIGNIIRANMSTDAKHLITTRLDNDDAIGKKFIETVQRNFLVQDFEFINMTNGYIYNQNRLYFERHLSNPFLSLIETVADCRTVWCKGHRKVASIGKVRQIEIDPLWFQIFHNKTATPRIVGNRLRVPLSRLHNRFVFDYDYAPNSENMFLLYAENARKILMSSLRKTILR